jgi:hypothetical protein
MSQTMFCFVGWCLEDLLQTRATTSISSPYPSHQCLSRQRTQRVHTSIYYCKFRALRCLSLVLLRQNHFPYLNRHILTLFILFYCAQSHIEHSSRCSNFHRTGELTSARLQPALTLGMQLGCYLG